MTPEWDHNQRPARILRARPAQRYHQREKPEARTFCWWGCNSTGLTSTALSYPWKLVLREDYGHFKTKGGTHPWLFNIEDDLPETKNLAARHPEKVEQLKAVFDEWVEEMPEPRW